MLKFSYSTRTATFWRCTWTPTPQANCVPVSSRWKSVGEVVVPLSCQRATPSLPNTSRKGTGTGSQPTANAPKALASASPWTKPKLRVLLPRSAYSVSTPRGINGALKPRKAFQEVLSIRRSEFGPKMSVTWESPSYAASRCLKSIQDSYDSMSLVPVRAGAQIDP